MKSIDNLDKMMSMGIGEQIIRTECCDEKYRMIYRLVDISCIATFLRNTPLNNLNNEERSKFLEFQNYFVDLESECFNEANFE